MRLEDAIVRVTRLDCQMAPYDWAFAREETARIDAHWTLRRQATPALFDGRILLMHEFAIADGCLRCSCFGTSYRSFLAWRELGFPGTPVANCFGMAALRAADGTFMLGEMSASTAAAGKLYFPAGTPEPKDADAMGRVDLEANVLRELAEETGIGADAVTLDATWTVVIHGPLVACMKLVQARATVADLQEGLKAFNASQTDPELIRLVPVSSPADYDADRMPGFMLRYFDWALSRG